jgi:hypothetical protein
MMIASFYVRRVLGIGKSEGFDLATAIEHLETPANDTQRTLSDLGQTIVMSGWQEVNNLPADYADVLGGLRDEILPDDNFEIFDAGFGVIIAAARQEKFRTLKDRETCADIENSWAT